MSSDKQKIGANKNDLQASSTSKLKVTLENEEILLRILMDMLNIHKDMYALEVEREKIFGDMAVSMRDISEGVIEIAHKLPYIEDEDVKGA